MFVSLGHIYAGGALFGLCHDYIIMNSERGFFCFPEVNYVLSITSLFLLRLCRKNGLKFLHTCLISTSQSFFSM